LDPTSKEMKIYMSSNGSSWDIADGRSLGRVKASRWTYYSVSRDEDGWFYAHNDGKLTDKWYSTLALPSSTAAFSVGLTESTQFGYFGFDEFSIRKSQCLYKAESYDPPVIEERTTLPGDYLVDTAGDGTGTDISDDLTITATYDSIGVDYELTNGNAADGFVYYLTARGLGVYAFNPVDEIAKDDASILAIGYQSLTLRQPYQQNIISGLAKAETVVTNEADPLTRCESVTLVANRSEYNALLFLMADVGKLIQITHVPSGLSSAHHYIQSVSYAESEGGIVRFTLGLRRDFAH
jgi:hypothetical protein